jgi:carbon storage regulator
MVVRAGRAIFLDWKWRQEVRIMLVITRREGEEVVIGNPSEPIGVIRIASIKGDRVRIALDFPREIAVHRREVASEIAKSGPTIAGKIRPASSD